MNVLAGIFRDNRFRSEYVPRFEAKLFYEGEQAAPISGTFFVLLTLATIIATVIAALIVAPLMTPIMATAAALASGVAGAFALSRDDIADSLPGVAIAISLVPPLRVVGLSLLAGEINAATGAMLLFITNFLAIILAGGATDKRMSRCR